MARAKHTPIRTCVACRTSGAKRGLMRIVRTPDGAVVHDPTGKAAGRGAYLCADPACISVAQKKRILDRHLRQSVPVDVYDALRAALVSQRDATTSADPASD